MSGSRSGLLDLVLEGVEPLLQKESRSGYFGAKMVPSLNGVDPSFMNSVTGSVCRAECSNILQDNITIVNGGSRVIRMMLHVVMSPTIVNLTALEVSFMLLENIYSTGITYDRQNIFIVQATGMFRHTCIPMRECKIRTVSKYN
jgi:hypothetical protein